ncbi:MAG: aminotransferase class I/II-fold pyridoxal phosphate-dependent enzyme [Thermaerobacter sp.]|nr:aminotransferase class I/II-fold pyridoxal phosphate-dependent enzyme [Thermaerobacter sp.]
MKELAAVSLDTLLVHAGNPDSTLQQIPTSPAIFPSTSYRVDSPERMDAILAGDEEGYTYGRHGSPTVEAFASAVAALEGAAQAVAFGSGMAAVDAAWHAIGVKSGDAVLISRDLYGASLNLTHNLWGRSGVRTLAVDLTDLAALARALNDAKPVGLLFETLSNPLLKVPDLQRVIDLCHQAGCQVIVDNTFATPLMVRPLDLGADLVVHSATKYLGGHGDALGGVVAGGIGYASALHQYLKLRGGVLGPFEAWLLHRGLKTLGVRFERQCDNAREVARALAASGLFAAVYHPLLPDHPTHALAVRQFGARLGGAVVTVDLPGPRDLVFRFLKGLNLVGSATTVGDVYTLCLYPRIASHRNQTAEELAAMGIRDGTVRIAVGIENPDDIVKDLLTATRAAVAMAPTSSR